MTLSKRFKAERVDVSMISPLSDGELARVGLDTIGDSHKLRRLCTQKKVKCMIKLPIYK
uniref:Uncharacterized protein n=1 Tax=Magallana gigas TaxID=29159 RepID=K1PUW3_MAGGI